jgi:phosphate transport system substrate-binding protein
MIKLLLNATSRCPENSKRNFRNLYSTVSGVLIVSAIILSSANCKAKTKILIDGSSTVYPITEAVAEEYKKASADVNVTVGISGTGGGFKKFCNGETDISDASRAITSDERKACAAKNIEYIELPVAFDGIAIVVSSKNNFVKELTVEDLKKIFKYDSPAKTWKDVHPSWPNMPIKIYSPGHDSGTYDYFAEAILGKKGKVRADASFSEDDNVLVTGVNGSEFAIGYFGVAYYLENKNALNLVGVVNPKTKRTVKPDIHTVSSGEYAPLSRPIFIYVNTKSNEKPEVKKFVDFYLQNVSRLVTQVGYIPFRPEFYAVIQKRFTNKIKGTVFDSGHEGKTLDQLYK